MQKGKGLPYYLRSGEPAARGFSVRRASARAMPQLAVCPSRWPCPTPCGPCALVGAGFAITAVALRCCTRWLSPPLIAPVKDSRNLSFVGLFALTSIAI